jgi:hypothetical protein
MKNLEIHTMFICIVTLVLVFFSINCTDSPVESKPDIVPPEIILSNTFLVIEMGDTVPYPVCSAMDAHDGNLTSKISRNGTVNLARSSRYILQYSVNDTSGNSATASCTIEVKIPSTAVLYLPFDGDIADKSKNGLTGLNQGAVLAKDRFNNPQSAYHFNGSSYIEFDNTELNIPNTFAVSVWAKSDIMGNKYTDEGFIADIGFVADSGYGIRLHAADGKVVPYYNKLPTNTSTIPVLDTLWHHYVLQFNGTNLMYFVDGAKKINILSTVGTISKSPFRIGSQSKSITRFWKGTIDDILITSAPFSDIRIKNLAFQTDSVNSADTVKVPIDTTPTVITEDGLKAEITGASGNLQLKLSWNAISGALAYGIYYNEGTSVSKNDSYRIAVNNYKIFTTDLTENSQYTFAFTYTKDDVESELSKPLTITYKLP